MKKSCFVLAMALSAGVISTTWASETSPALTGRVRHEDGSPIEKARVFIYTAGPKEGRSSICPSCYADCQKEAQTDSEGRFEMESLDPKLKFRLLVVAPGHESRFVGDVDPATGSQEITLQERNEEILKSKARIAGMIMDEKGRSVVGAVISPEGVQRGRSTRWGATDEFVDPAGIADDNGRFLLMCQDGVDTVHAVLEGPGVAKQWVEFKPGHDHLIRMEEGVEVTGRIERDGKPLKDVVVGLVTADRACGNFLRCDELATDQEGRFLIPNVPPGRDFVMYAKMDSMGGRGVVPSRMFRTGRSGTTSDLEMLAVQPGFRLKGRVVLSDGGAIPPDTRLYFGREAAWDGMEVTLDSEGRFEITDVPAESVSLGVRIKGYKYSKRNPSLDWLNGGIVGKVDGDITDLVLLLEPGEWHHSEERNDAPPGTDLQPKDKPLRGTEL